MLTLLQILYQPSTSKELINLGVAIWVRIRLFDSIRNELNGFGFEKIDSFNK